MYPIEELFPQESLSKSLSSLYLALLSEDSPKMGRPWDRWETDLPGLDREDWEDCLEDSIKLLISSKDKLIQVRILQSLLYPPPPETVQDLLPEAAGLP